MHVATEFACEESARLTGVSRAAAEYWAAIAWYRKRRPNAAQRFRGSVEVFVTCLRMGCLSSWFHSQHDTPIILLFDECLQVTLVEAQAVFGILGVRIEKAKGSMVYFYGEFIIRTPGVTIEGVIKC